MVVVLVTREIAVTGLRAMAAAEGQVMAAEELGKYKMVLQSIAIQGLLIHYIYFHVELFRGRDVRPLDRDGDKRVVRRGLLPEGAGGA